MPDAELKEIETKVCMVCGLTGVVRVTKSEYTRWQQETMHGRVLGSFPSLTPAEREQFFSGVHEACYLKLFPEHTFDKGEESDLSTGTTPRQPPQV